MLRHECVAATATESASTRIDNRPVSTTNTYDALNRIQQTSYSDTTPSVTYTYDAGANAKGQLTSVATNGVSTTSFTSFDVMGRVLASTQQTGSQTFNFTYGFNYAGSLTSEKYPSGRTITIGYDGAKRQSSIYGTLNGQGTAYINSVGYAAHGGLAGYFMGNQLTPQQLYNNRLQMSSIAIRKSNDQNQSFFYQANDWGSTNNNGVRLYGKSESIANHDVVFAVALACWKATHTRSIGDGPQRLPGI